MSCQQVAKQQIVCKAAPPLSAISDGSCNAHSTHCADIALVFFTAVCALTSSVCDMQAQPCNNGNTKMRVVGSPQAVIRLPGVPVPWPCMYALSCTGVCMLSSSAMLSRQSLHQAGLLGIKVQHSCCNWSTKSGAASSVLMIELQL